MFFATDLSLAALLRCVFFSIEEWWVEELPQAAVGMWMTSRWHTWLKRFVLRKEWQQKDMDDKELATHHFKLLLSSSWRVLRCTGPLEGWTSSCWVVPKRNWRSAWRRMPSWARWRPAPRNWEIPIYLSSLVNFVWIGTSQEKLTELEVLFET